MVEQEQPEIPRGSIMGVPDSWMSEKDRIALQQSNFLLVTSVQTMVPLMIMEMQRWPLDRIIRRGKSGVDTITSNGDLILFKSKKHGETGSATGVLARSIAAGAFVPGGIRYLGIHFEADTLHDSEETSQTPIEEIALPESESLEEAQQALFDKIQSLAPKPKAPKGPSRTAASIPLPQMTLFDQQPPTEAPQQRRRS